MDTQAALTAINELNNLLNSNDWRLRAWKSNPEKRAVEDLRAVGLIE